MFEPGLHTSTHCDPLAHEFQHKHNNLCHCACCLAAIDPCYCLFSLSYPHCPLSFPVILSPLAVVTAIWGWSQTIIIVVFVISFPHCLLQHCCHISHVTVTDMPDLLLHFANLNELNDTKWSLYMQSTLIKKELWKVVEGSETCPLGWPNSKAVKAFEHY